MNASTLRSWAHPSHGREPLLTTTPAPHRRPSVPFIGLAEAFVISVARGAGVPDHRIRPGVERIKAEAGGVDHALASRLVYVDGAEILWQTVEDDPDLEVARTTQRQFTDTVRNQLKLIEYDPRDHFARRLRLPHFKLAEVIVDPGIAAGRPFVRRGVGVRVKDLRDRVLAGDPEADVSRDFGVPLEELKDVIRSA